MAKKYLYQGDCLDVLRSSQDWKINTIFADPPDNIGNKYAESDDRMPDSEYYDFLRDMIHRSVPRCETFFLSYYHRHDIEVSKMILPGWKWRKIIWRFTFGQYRDNDHASGFRPILRIGRPGHLDNIRIESARMKLGDSRASGYRVPDDVWDFSRIPGNSKERRSWHPTQHPEALMERLINLSQYTVDETWPPPFLDLFLGTGTSFRAGASLGVEISPTYCKEIVSEHKAQSLPLDAFLQQIRQTQEMWSEPYELSAPPEL